jgi:N-acetylglutamate synthase/N-acetylornithine aminotransferase
LSPAVEQLRAEGRAVFGVAPSAAAADELADAAGVAADQVAVASTGVIGVALDGERVATGTNAKLVLWRTDGPVRVTNATSSEDVRTLDCA